MRKQVYQHLLIVLFIILVSALGAHAQQAKNPFVLGVTEEITSKELSEKRILNIYLPEGYKKDNTKKFPVIYLLDGSSDEDFIHVVGVVQFLTMIQEMPETIVVGIANVDRRRDFTFPTTIDSDKKAYPTTGRSERFISFLEKELQPYIEHNYRTNESKTLIGESLGGLLATEILLKKPQLFNTYVIVSPSLWWDHESLLAKAPALLKSLPANDMKVYIAVGSEGTVMETDAKQLYTDLKPYESGHLQLYFASMPEENHLTILHQCVYRALERLNGKK